MKLILQIFTSGIVLFLLFGYFRSESYFPLYPTLDTQLPPGFSERNFELITPGITKADVIKLLGEPDIKYASSPRMKATLEAPSRWIYGNDGGCRGLCDMAWIMYEINFNSEDKVITKKRTIFHD